MSTWVIAFAYYPGVIDNHYPKDKLLQFVNMHALVLPKIMRQTPILGAQVIFTDGASNGTAAYVIQGKGYKIFTPPASAQFVELRAVAAIFQKMDACSFNLYTESHYIARALGVLETGLH